MACGGRTGGHVYPILAVLEELKASESDLEAAWLGSGGELEERILAGYGFQRYQIAAGGLRGLAPWRALVGLVKMAWGTVEAYRAMKGFRPEVLLASGGFGAVPAALAARLAGVPSLLYLPDMEPGLAVRVLARLVSRVAISFPEVRERWPVANSVVTGYPVREGIGRLEELQARERLGLDPEAKLLLVLGGSQGAHSINLALSQALEALLPHCQILHISGSRDYPWLVERRETLPGEMRARYHLHGYLHEEMPDALDAADLALARAGAAVLGEFPAARLPAILVPYPHAGSHQAVNAAFLVKKGAAIMMEDRELNAARLQGAVLELLTDEGARGRMAEAAGRLWEPGARANLVRELKLLAGHVGGREATCSRWN